LWHRQFHAFDPAWEWIMAVANADNLLVLFKGLNATFKELIGPESVAAAFDAIKAAAA